MVPCLPRWDRVSSGSDQGLDNECDNTYYGGMARDLRTELKQNRPFGNVRQEAWLSIQRTAAVHEHAFETITVLRPRLDFPRIGHADSADKVGRQDADLH